jgi:hypothetical protein
VIFTATLKKKIQTDDFWICDSGACGHYYKSDKDLSYVKDINQNITLGIGEIRETAKVGSLKCHVIQLTSSSVNVTLKEVKYVPEI